MELTENRTPKGTLGPLGIKDWSLSGKGKMLTAIVALHGSGFITLINLFFCTNYSPGATVFSLNKPRRGIRLSLCLTKKEIRELTLKVRHSAQTRTLSEMGIRHTLRPDGSPVVLYSTLSELMDNPKRRSIQPDFSSLGQ